MAKGTGGGGRRGRATEPPPLPGAARIRVTDEDAFKAIPKGVFLGILNSNHIHNLTGTYESSVRRTENPERYSYIGSKQTSRKRQVVDIGSLLSGQRKYNPSIVKGYAEGTRSSSEDPRNLIKDPVVVVFKHPTQGREYRVAFNGNHRILAAASRGARRIRAEVSTIEFDNEQAWRSFEDSFLSWGEPR